MNEIPFEGKSGDWLVGQNEAGWFFYPADSNGGRTEFFCSEREAMYMLDLVDRSLAEKRGA